MIKHDIVVVGGRLAGGAGAPLAVPLLFLAASVISGLAWFLMGVLYWVRYYGVALTFFLTALFLPWQEPWAPLAFGALYSAVLLAIGLHLLRLTRPTRAEDQPSGRRLESSGRDHDGA